MKSKSIAVVKSESTIFYKRGVRMQKLIIGFVLGAAMFSPAAASFRDDLELHATFVGRAHSNPEKVTLYFNGPVELIGTVAETTVAIDAEKLYLSPGSIISGKTVEIHTNSLELHGNIHADDVMKFVPR